MQASRTGDLFEARIESAEIVEHVRARGGVLTVSIQDLLVG
jgi:hypothetical protein